MERKFFVQHALCALGVLFSVFCGGCNRATVSTQLLGNWIYSEISDNEYDSALAEKPAKIFASICFSQKNSSTAKSGSYDVFGFTGVNNFSSQAKIGEAEIVFSDAVTTMMAGDENTEKFERSFMTVLNQAVSYEIQNDELKIFASDGSHLSFVKFYLENSMWQLLAFKKGDAIQTVEEGKEIPALTFIDAEKFSAFSGINQINSTYKADVQKIKFANFGVTKMANPDLYATELEAIYISLLEAAKNFIVQASATSINLILQDANENALLVFETANEF